MLPAATLHAQVEQSERFEIHLPSSEKHFEIIGAEDHGLYLHRTFYTTKDDQLHLVKLDTSFQQQWNGYLPLEKNYLLMGKRAFKDKLYLLLRYKDYSKNDFILFIVDEAGNYSRYSIRGYIPISPTEFQITDHAVLIGGYYNRVPLVLFFSLTEFNSRVVPGLFNESGELTQVRTYDDGSFDILISALNFKRQRTIWIKNYDPQGNLNSNYSLDSEDNKHLIFGRSIKTGNNNQIVAGVYGTRSTEYSHGIFIARIDPAGYQQIRYYNFGDLENFFKYMKAKREARVKNRIERRKIKGKKIRLNYRFLVHELVPYKDQFVLLGEAFYPKYITVDRGYSGGFFTPSRYSGAIIQNGRIFDGYYYTHAVVMGFKADGDLVWDNSFEINDIRTFTLEQFVKLDVQDDKIALLYLFDNNIRTKIIKDNQVLEGKSEDPIKTSLPDELVKKTSEVSKLEYWYGEYLYAYGVQELHKTKGQEKQRIFYINKVKHSR